MPELLALGSAHSGGIFRVETIMALAARTLFRGAPPPGSPTAIMTLGGPAFEMFSTGAPTPLVTSILSVAVSRSLTLTVSRIASVSAFRDIGIAIFRYLEEL